MAGALTLADARAPDPRADARRLAEVAERHLRRLEARARGLPEPTRGVRLARGLERTRRWFVRKTRELVQEHWDVALFDVIFGSVKAFGIYPALYFAGLTWTIPLLEYAPLNTQLWTAGYLFARRQLLSELGRRRYGHSLNEIDAFRDRALAVDPRDARRIHRFSWDGSERVVRCGRSRAAEWIRRIRGRAREPGVWLQGELRALVGDATFLFCAGELRSNAFLYEEVLIRRILRDSEARAALLEGLPPEPPLATEEDRALGAILAESLEPAHARVIEQGNSLTEALRERLGSSVSATSLALRWINWSYQRTLYGRLAELERLGHRLVAELLDGATPAASEYARRIRELRSEIEVWMGAATRFGSRAAVVASKPEGIVVARAGIEEAQRRGRPVRLARLALRLSPTARRAPAPEART